MRAQHLLEMVECTRSTCAFASLALSQPPDFEFDLISATREYIYSAEHQPYTKTVIHTACFHSSFVAGQC
jgi:hypothetical protein